MLPHERHYTLRQLAVLWGPKDEAGKTIVNKKGMPVMYFTIRRWFIIDDGTLEPGVINAGTGSNVVLRIPESVAQRVYDRHLANRRVA